MSKDKNTEKMSWGDIDGYSPSNAPTGLAVLSAIEDAKADREELARLNKQAREMRGRVAAHRDAIEQAIALDKETVDWAEKNAKAETVTEGPEMPVTENQQNW